MGRLGGGGAASGNSGGGRINTDAVAQLQANYADNVRRKNRLNELNLSAQGKSSYSSIDALKLAKQAMQDGDISQDDFTNFAKNNWAQQQAKIQSDAKANFDKNTLPIARFAAGIGGAIKDNLSFQKDDNGQDTLGTKGSIVRSVLGDPATAIMTQVEVSRAQQAQEMASQLLKATKRDYGQDLKDGKITQKQYDTVVAKAQANFDKANKVASHNVSVSSKRDPTKDAAAVASIPLNAATGGSGASIVKVGLEDGIKSAVGRFAGNVAGDTLIGGAQGANQTIQDEGKDLKTSDLLKNTGFGAIIGGGTSAVGRVARSGGSTVDKAVGGRIADAGSHLTSHEGIISRLNELKNDGLIGAIDKTVSNAGKKLGYAADDLLRSTKVGAKIGDSIDKFNSRFVTNMHNVYKLARRSDFEGKTKDGEATISNAVNDAYRSEGFADHIVDNDSGIKKWREAVQAQGGDIQQAIKNTDNYIAARQEKELMDSGQKTYSAKQKAKVNAEWDAVKAGPHQAENEKAYEGLVEAYSNKLDRDHANGLIEDDVYKQFKEDPNNYIRVQREQPEWKLDKPTGQQGGGTKMSVGSTTIVQKRSKFASGEQMSPIQTYLEANRYSTKKHYENVAAKTIYDVLKQGGKGDVKLLRTTDAVLQKRELLHDAHGEKLEINRLNRSLKGHRSSYAALAKEVTKLKAQGRTRVAQELNKAIKALRKEGDATPDKPFSAREAAEALSTLDHKDFRKLRKMIESRNGKLSDILDTIQNINADLNDAYARKNGLLSDMRGLRTNPDLKNVEHFEFLEKGIKNVVRTDPGVAAAIKGYNKESSNVLVNWLRLPTTIFKLGTTTANVAFAMVNLPKDLQESLINSQRAFSTHLNPLNHMAVLAASAGRPIGAKEREMLEQFAAANKGGRFIDIYRAPRSAEAQAIETAAKGKNPIAMGLNYVKHPTKGGPRFVRLMDDLLGKTEDYTRYLNWRGTYLKAIKSGRNHAEAYQIANKASRENSINFLEHGDVGQVINSIIPYFNATVQSNRMLLRTFRDRPVSALVKTSVFLSTPVAVTTYYNTNDPKRKAVYQTIPDYVKKSNFVIVGPDAKWDDENKKWNGVTIIPKPIGYGSLTEPLRQFIEWQSDQSPEDHNNIAKFLLADGANAGGSLVNSFSPIDFTSKDGFFSSITPQILKPSLESFTNKDFYSGEQIVKGTMNDLPAEAQRYDRESQLSIYVGALLNTSPLKVDHWIKGTFGEVGTNAQNYADRYLLGGKDGAVNPETGKTGSTIGGRSLGESVSRRFLNVPGQQDKNDFYDTYNPVAAKQTRVESQITNLIGQGKTQQAHRVADDFNNSIEGYFKSFKSKYANSPTYDDGWNDMIDKLQIKTTDRAFNQRLKNYQKKNE